MDPPGDGRTGVAGAPDGGARGLSALGLMATARGSTRVVPLGEEAAGLQSSCFKCFEMTCITSICIEGLNVYCKGHSFHGCKRAFADELLQGFLSLHIAAAAK